jgi:hypothetical protein
MKKPILTKDQLKAKYDIKGWGAKKKIDQLYRQQLAYDIYDNVQNIKIVYGK